jgi:spore germination cell wall hydrolase CwlJ-like protein
MTILQSLSDQEVIARTLWGEARSQGVMGMVAVACVIMNRSYNPGWWGTSLRGVCLAPMQFSCWNDSDPQAEKMRSPINDMEYVQASTIAEMLFNHSINDITNGADHYRAEYAHPVWADGKLPTYICGVMGSRHMFYKLGLVG